MKRNRSLSRFGGEVWRGVAQSNSHTSCFLLDVVLVVIGLQLMAGHRILIPTN